MNTLTNRLRAGALGITLATTCVAAWPAYAQDGSSKPQRASKQENIGVATGFTVGAVAGGPIGAIVGAAAGAWLGDRYHKQVTTNTTLASDLSKSEAERTRLAQNVTQLSGSLSDAQARSAKLDEALKITDELQTDVSFRTNDASINAPSMSPLLKLGALAASMPDVKVRVAGYADPRGSDEVNDALSQRRAEAVAAVLANAGVAKNRLIVEGHGKSESTSTDGDLDGYAFDRRVTVRLERPGTTEVASRE
jgi:outer membrane protein OmpA-like peptidoglycan-associated protein